MNITVLQIFYFLLSFHACLTNCSETDCNSVNNKDQIVENDIDWSLNSLEQDDPRLISVLKEKYLSSPPKKPYNLNQGGSLKSISGQYGQSIFLDEKYFR
jgi:hypothetical protein